MTKKTTILLVDDKEDFLATLAERVGLQEGVEVLTATTGQKALEAVKGKDVTLAVVDLKLPDMDGLDCITLLKKKQPGMETVLLTAYGSDKTREATLALNTAYFEKQDMGGFWEFIKAMSHRPTFLLVDDEEQFLDTLSERVLLKGFEVLTATTAAQAEELAEKHRIDYAVVDLKIKDDDGLMLITKLKTLQPEIKTMLLTAFGSDRLEQATKALNSGYFEKQDMGGFWEFMKSIPKRLENTMAAAGMATHGDLDDAEKIESGKNGS